VAWRCCDVAARNDLNVNDHARSRKAGHGGSSALETIMSTHKQSRPHGVSRPAGFTLIELLVVIAIISLLVSILLPSLNRAKKLAKNAICLSNLRSLGLSAGMYHHEYNEATIGWDTLVNNGIEGDWTAALADYAGGEVKHEGSIAAGDNNFPGLYVCPDSDAEMQQFQSSNNFWWLRHRTSYSPPFYFSSPVHPDTTPSDGGWFGPKWKTVNDWVPNLTPMLADIKPLRIGKGTTFYFSKTDINPDGRLSYRHGTPDASGQGSINAVFLDGHAEGLSPSESETYIMHDQNELMWYSNDNDRISW
jgi:prepilin-type N-terminal cleavage/methylation domain-containing protein/prepilin-type processing-associated H-X9-DG protein